MQKLRQTVISRIYLTLEASDFSLRDFDVNTEEDGNFVHIYFTPDVRFDFQITEKDISVKSHLVNFMNQEPPEIRLVTIESPGEYKNKDVLKHNSIDECIKRISYWCRNIKEELAAPIPIKEELEDFELEIERQINEAAGNGDEKFSEMEISSLKQKLDILAEKFEDMELSKAITESELAQIKVEIEKMKGTLPTYPKSTWYKTAGHKFIDVTKRILKTKEGRELLLDSTKKIAWFGLMRSRPDFANPALIL